QLIPQVPPGGRLNAETLTQYYVNSAAGQPVPLSNLVTVKTTTAPNALTRYNQLNSATFQAVPMPGVAMGQAVDFLEKQAAALPAGFSHDYLSDSRQYVTEGSQLVVTFIFALIVIFLVLAAQFESLRDPLVIPSGAGAASRFSIGVVVVAGMSIGTLFTLFVLPAVYTVLAKDHAAAAHSVRARELAQVS